MVSLGVSKEKNTELSIPKPYGWWHDVLRRPTYGHFINADKYISINLKYKANSVFNIISLTCDDFESECPEGIYLSTKIPAIRTQDFDHFLLVTTTIIGDFLCIEAMRQNIPLKIPMDTNMSPTDIRVRLDMLFSIRGDFFGKNSNQNAVFSLRPCSEIEYAQLDRSTSFMSVVQPDLSRFNLQS